MKQSPEERHQMPIDELGRFGLDDVDLSMLRSGDRLGSATGAKWAAAIERLLAERDEATTGSNRLMASQNAIVRQVWDLIGGEDATREGGQNLVTRVAEIVSERDRLKEALKPFAEWSGGSKVTPVAARRARQALEDKP